MKAPRRAPCPHFVAPHGCDSSHDCTDPLVRAATMPQLLAHRDFIYREYLELPVELWARAKASKAAAIR